METSNTQNITPIQAPVKRPVEGLLNDSLVNSTATYIAVFLGFYILNQFCISGIAWIWKIHNTLNYWGADLSTYQGKWSRVGVVLMYGLGPVLSLLIVALSVRGYFLTHKRPGIAKTIYTWAIVHGLIFFFGSAAVGAFTKGGFAYSMVYLKLPYEGCIVVAILSIIVLIAVGIKFINFFMYLAPSLELFDGAEIKIKFLFYVAILPYFIGSLILLLFQVPALPTANILMILFPGLILLPVWAASRGHHGSVGVAPEPNF
jgi:hypothetical protein